MPALAADIRALHAGIRRGAEQVASDAIEAGHKLIEAKALLQHGQWEDWLREHVAIAPRTARLYMRLARSGLEPATVAEIGLNYAARGVVIDHLQVERVRASARKAWANFLEAGRQYGAMLDMLGEDQFRAWIQTKTEFDADEVRLLVEIARVTDAGGDVGELLARDDVPKCLTFPAGWLERHREVELGMDQDASA